MQIPIYLQSGANHVLTGIAFRDKSVVRDTTIRDLASELYNGIFPLHKTFYLDMHGHRFEISNQKVLMTCLGWAFQASARGQFSFYKKDENMLNARNVFIFLRKGDVTECKLFQTQKRLCFNCSKDCTEDDECVVPRKRTSRTTRAPTKRTRTKRLKDVKKRTIPICVKPSANSPPSDPAPSQISNAVNKDEGNDDDVKEKDNQNDTIAENASFVESKFPSCKYIAPMTPYRDQNGHKKTTGSAGTIRCDCGYTRAPPGFRKLQGFSKWRIASHLVKSEGGIYMCPESKKTKSKSMLCFFKRKYE